jgi:hypothetical protein
MSTPEPLVAIFSHIDPQVDMRAQPSLELRDVAERDHRASLTAGVSRHL